MQRTVAVHFSLSKRGVIRIRHVERFDWVDKSVNDELKGIDNKIGRFIKEVPDIYSAWASRQQWRCTIGEAGYAVVNSTILES